MRAIGRAAKYLRDEWGLYVFTSRAQGDEPEVSEFLWGLYDDLRMRTLGRWLCRAGHVDVDVEGYAGPDSGGEYWDCRCCGAGGDAVFY